MVLYDERLTYEEEEWCIKYTAETAAMATQSALPYSTAVVKRYVFEKREISSGY